MTQAARITASLLGALLTVALWGVPSEAAPTHHGQDPLQSGCSSDARTIMTRGAGSTYYEVRYSPRCGTNWIRFPRVPNGAEVYAAIRSDSNSTQTFSMTQVGRGGSHWTRMVYAPGSTCIEFIGSYRAAWYRFWQSSGWQRVC